VVFHFLVHEELIGETREELLLGEGKVAPLQGKVAPLQGKVAPLQGKK
jgi:hypothetical protein